MNSSELLDLFRREVSDVEAPYLWSDEEVFSYIDDAQKWFCRRTYGIADARTTEVVKLNIVPDTEWYSLHKSILYIRKATRDDTGAPVNLRTPEQADSAGIRFTSDKGVLRALVLGLDASAARTVPIPSETVTVSLVVFRLPLVKISDLGDQELEVDEQHHNSLLLWMKHRAYDKQDAETFDKRKSEDYRTKFYAYCAGAKQEQDRANRVLGTVEYGGI